MTTLLETGLAPTKLRNAKTTMRDGHNRPIVVVTGMGVITSLGEGKTENWAKLTAGEFGNKHHPALLHPRTEDAHRRHHRLRRGEAVLLDDVGRASGRYRHRRGCRPIRNWTKGRFSGSRCFSVWRRSKSSGRNAKKSHGPPAKRAL